MSVIESMIVQVGANIQPLIQGLNGAVSTVSSTGKRIDGILNTMNRSFAVLGVSLGVGTFAAFAKNALSAADDLIDLSEAVGVSTDSIQELRYAASESGLEVTQLDAAITRFSSKLGDAIQGGGAFADTLENLGISLLNTEGNVRSVDSILNDLAEAIKNATSEQERLAIATDAFGKDAAPGMVRILMEGTAGLQEFREAAREAGLVIENNLLQNAKSINEEFDRMTYLAGTRAKGAVLELIASLQWLAEVSPTELTERITRNAMDMAGGGPERQRLNRELFLELDRQRAGSRGTSDSPRQIIPGTPRAKPDQIVDFESPTKRSRNTMSDAERELNRLKEEGERLTRSVMNAEEERAYNIEQWSKLLQNGSINQETYNRLVKEQATEMQKARVSTDRLKDSTRELNTAVVNTFQDLSREAMSAASGADFLRNALARVAQQVAELAMSDLSGLFGKGAKNGIGNMFGNVLGSLFGSSKVPGAGKIPSYDVGTDYVPQDQLAMVHKGERILTAQENRAGRSASGGTQITQNFHISTGVQQTVRAEMARYSKTIKAQTAGAVMDAQRRGKLA